MTVSSSLESMTLHFSDLSELSRKYYSYRGSFEQSWSMSIAICSRLILGTTWLSSACTLRIGITHPLSGLLILILSYFLPP